MEVLIDTSNITLETERLVLHGIREDGLAGGAAEYWDVYDAERNKTGRTHRRGDPLPEGDYHLVVLAWIINSKGKFLITRRDLNKIGYPGMWEPPSGSALAGEDSLSAAIREAQEESGIPLLPERAKLFSTYRRGDSFYDNYLFRHDFSLSDVVLQEGETIDARIASWDEIDRMMSSGEFIGREVFPEFELLQNAAFWSAIDTLILQSEIVIERPKGTKHPRYDFVYPLDYGYLKDTTSPDGGGIDVWRGSLSERLCDAVICTIDLLKRDSEIKLLIGCTEDEKTIIMNSHNYSEYMKGAMMRRVGI